MFAEYTDIGAETLRRINALEGYNRWVVEEIMPYVGNRVLEVGSGTGTMSQFFLESERLILTDKRRLYIDRLSETFQSYPNVTCELFDLEGSGGHLAGKGIDTVVGLNVLEHIRDDCHALKEIASILSPGGRVILQLPAHKLLYGSLDNNLDHFRRYTVRDIRFKFNECGFNTEHIWMINMFGTFGWFLCSRILKKKILPKGQLSLFNKLTPVFIAIEKLIPAPFGLSIIAVGRRPEEQTGKI